MLPFKNQTLPKNLVRNRAMTLDQPRSKPTYDFSSVSKKFLTLFGFFGGIWF